MEVQVISSPIPSAIKEEEPKQCVSDATVEQAETSVTDTVSNTLSEQSNTTETKNQSTDENTDNPQAVANETTQTIDNEPTSEQTSCEKAEIQSVEDPVVVKNSEEALIQEEAVPIATKTSQEVKAEEIQQNGELVVKDDVKENVLNEENIEVKNNDPRIDHFEEGSCGKRANPCSENQSPPLKVPKIVA